LAKAFSFFNTNAACIDSLWLFWFQTCSANLCHPFDKVFRNFYGISHDIFKGFVIVLLHSLYRDIVVLKHFLNALPLDLIGGGNFKAIIGIVM